MTSANEETPAGVMARIMRLARDQRVSFLLVGGFNTGFGFLVFVGVDVAIGRPLDSVIGHQLSSLVVLAVSHIIGVFVAYQLYRRFVFKVVGHYWRDLARFESVYLVSLGINAVALPLLVTLGLPRIPSQFAITVVTAVGSFVAHRYFSFRRPKGASSVRRALVEDAPGIAAVHVQAWRETYAGLLPSEFLEGLDVAPRTERWSTIISETTDVWVALDGERIIGWLSAGPGRDVDAPRPRELEGIYVLADHYGTGAGQALLDAGLGDAASYLWIADGNPRAEHFYVKNGFARDGAAKVERIGGVDLAVVRMVR